MKTTLMAMLAVPVVALAGGDAPMVEAPHYDQELNQISLREAEELFKQGVTFYDVNTLEIWASGHVPNAIYFNVSDWKTLLPKDKNKTIVFYCADRLCTSSEIAAREVMKLGYKDVRQCPHGIYGWALAGNPVELP